MLPAGVSNRLRSYEYVSEIIFPLLPVGLIILVSLGVLSPLFTGTDRWALYLLYIQKALYSVLYSVNK